VSITADNAQQTEGNAGSITYTFTVSLTGSAFATQTVNFAIAGSGANAADGNDLSGLLAGTLTFLVGETSKTVSINVLGDTTVEQDETFTVTLSGQTSGLTLGTATATATILNDDVAGPNIVNGDDGNNSLPGTVGIDHMFGMAGNDLLGGSAGADILDGGNDTDTADYRNSTGSNVSISLLANTASGGHAEGDQLISIENLYGSLTQRDILIGDNSANTINGFGGNDSLRGEDGNDYLVGGAGADAISGGAGSQDWAGYRDNVSGSVNINLLANTYSGGDATGDTLFFIENLEGSLTLRDILIGNDVANIIIGNGGVDSIRGEGGNDVINGGAGADSLSAGAGIDTVTYETSAVGVTVDLNITIQVSGGDANGDSLYFFENVTGSGKDDSLHGNYVSNRLVGGSGLDTLDGGTGSDYLTGGADADVFRFADPSFGADTITDWQDGTDQISIALPLETSFAGLSITGNGTQNVIVRGFNTSGTIIIHSDVAFTLDAGDFIFV
jgi:Ca2+-binding RTX toxin-like protein